MSTVIAGKKLSTKPAEPDDRQRARQSKRHPDCRSTTIKLTAHANIACVIVGPRQSSSRRDRRNGHPDCRCVSIQIVALHWLNQVVVWFSILQGQSLSGASFTSLKQLEQHIDAYIKAYNNKAEPFVWTKKKVRQRRFKERRITQL